MKWLIITQDFPPGFIGGIAAWAADIAKALHDAGNDVTVLARRTQNVRGRDKGQPYRIVRMYGRNWNKMQGLWSRLHARQYIDQDVCVLTATWALGHTLLDICERRGARLFVAFHGSDITREREAHPGLRKVVERAHGLVPVSAFLREEIVRLVPEVDSDDRVRILPMPLPIPDKMPVGKRAGLLSVARLNELKGVDRAIDLAKALDIPLRVVGDGPGRKLVEEEARESGLVEVIGRQPREAVAQLYETALGVPLLPRTAEDGLGAEGLGLCLLEAAAKGAIPIGCRTGGVPEACGPGVVLEDADNPDLDQLRAALGDPELAVRCHAWVRKTHGPQRTVAVLQSF